ncbi:hypothetical protein [Campylobacter sp. RM12647]|uniref:hypothetical protein n=1 Tax=Campylobacter sp. RM12647 TaxID=2735737 RepID=UPI001D749479|nr:hypothetical protein [Campylobacter sp. RM12647]
MSYTKIILKSDEKLLNMIKALLEFSNTDFNIQKLNEEESELLEAIKECEENTKMILEGKRKPLSLDEFKKVSMSW